MVLYKIVTKPTLHHYCLLLFVFILNMYEVIIINYKEMYYYFIKNKYISMFGALVLLSYWSLID